MPCCGSSSAPCHDNEPLRGPGLLAVVAQHGPPPPLRGRSDRAAIREGGTKPPAHRAVSALHRGRAKSLRRNMTDAERCLWRILRGHRLAEFGFRPQVPMGPFTGDFVCHRHCLIVELDGGQHAVNVQGDLERDRWLRSKGYRVIRFWNVDVLRNLDGVLTVIRDSLSAEIPPSPTLPLKGGGGAPRSARAYAQDAIVPTPSAARRTLPSEEGRCPGATRSALRSGEG